MSSSLPHPAPNANHYSQHDISGGTNVLENIFGGLTISQ